MIPGGILDGILRESRYGSIGDAIADTGRRHGRAEGDADPWDYTASEIAHAIAEWHSVRLARDYLAAYAEGFAEGTEARKQRRAADIAACRWCGPGNGNRACDCHHAAN